MVDNSRFVSYNIIRSANFSALKNFLKNSVTSHTLFALFRVRGQKTSSRRRQEERDFIAMENELNDEEIVELYLARDESAIKHSQLKFGKRILNISKSITGNDLTAEEVENDTYLRAWENIPPTEPRSYLFAFLARIARNLSISICRERSSLKRRAVLVELSDEMEECIPSSLSVEAEAEGNMLMELINDFLFSKDEGKRNIFMRRYFYLDPIKEVAKQFGITESNAKTTLFRLREELREFLEARGIQV